MESKSHWEGVYNQKKPDAVSWFLESATTSLNLIHQIGLKHSDSIIDVGGGASRLVDDLLQQGFENLTVLDLSGSALKAAKERLGASANGITWLEADITQPISTSSKYQLWHDRAVFHFMTTPEQRAAYKKNLDIAVRPSGYAIIATFAENGPEQCSGLPVQRYSVESLSKELGSEFVLLNSCRESHKTPSGNTQEFIYCLYKLR
ncbi:MAG TPA: SAM-dependent methyltransferase [Alcaligenaceae bacterium]|nr:SAM-dependent methyltransferase [Alcaligenaceae bacterium]